MPLATAQASEPGLQQILRRLQFSFLDKSPATSGSSHNSHLKPPCMSCQPFGETFPQKRRESQPCTEPRSSRFGFAILQSIGSRLDWPACSSYESTVPHTRCHCDRWTLLSVDKAFEHSLALVIDNLFECLCALTPLQQASTFRHRRDTERADIELRALASASCRS